MRIIRAQGRNTAPTWPRIAQTTSGISQRAPGPPGDGHPYAAEQGHAGGDSGSDPDLASPVLRGVVVEFRTLHERSHRQAGGDCEDFGPGPAGVPPFSAPAPRGPNRCLA
nr:hypothetical protein GCM10020092_058470 [Actinoplanes digitatis]